MDTKKERAIIFIDGNNFYHGMLRAFELTPALDFDYAAFSKKLVGERVWVETRYYVGQLKQDDPISYKNQRKLFAHLHRQGINTFTGRFVTRQAKSVNKKLQHWLNKLPNRDDLTLPDQMINELTDIAEKLNQPMRTEKEVDVMIATDMISMAYEGKYDVAYLVSADTDFVPAIIKTREVGKQIFVASPQKSGELTQAANTFIKMKRAFFHDCWL